MAGRKVFTSGEILTAADVNSYLMNQVVAVFADSTARSSAIPSPSEGMVTYREDANRVEVYDGSAFGPIGGILQVVSTTKTDTFTTTSSSFTGIPGLSATITPSSSSSKIMIMAQVALGAEGQLRLSGGNSGDFVGNAAGSRTRATIGYAQRIANEFERLAQSAVINFLDSPATASAITYQVQITVRSGLLVVVNRTFEDANEGQTTRGASSITLMEVAV